MGPLQAWRVCFAADWSCDLASEWVMTEREANVVNNLIEWVYSKTWTGVTRILAGLVTLSQIPLIVWHLHSCHPITKIIAATLLQLPLIVSHLHSCHSITDASNCMTPTQQPSYHHDHSCHSTTAVSNCMTPTQLSLNHHDHSCHSITTASNCMTPTQLPPYHHDHSCLLLYNTYTAATISQLPLLVWQCKTTTISQLPIRCRIGFIIIICQKPFYYTNATKINSHSRVMDVGEKYTRLINIKTVKLPPLGLF